MRIVIPDIPISDIVALDPTTAAIELLQDRLYKAEAQIKELQKLTMYLPREE